MNVKSSNILSFVKQLRTIQRTEDELSDSMIINELYRGIKTEHNETDFI